MRNARGIVEETSKVLLVDRGMGCAEMELLEILPYDLDTFICRTCDHPLYHDILVE